MATAAQPTPSTPNPPQSITRQAVIGGAGLGLGGVILALANGHPELLAKIVEGWAPVMVLLGGTIAAVFGLVGQLIRVATTALDRHLPPFIDAQKRQAAALQEMSDTVRSRDAEDEDVRLSLRAQSTHLGRIEEKVDRLLRGIPHAQ